MLQVRGPLRKKIAGGENRVCSRKCELERQGDVLRLQRGYEVIAGTAKGSGRSVWLDSTLGIDLFIPGGKFFRKSPSESGYPGTVAIGESFRGKSSRRPRACARNCSKLAILFQSPAVIGIGHLAEDCVRGLKRRPSHCGGRWNRSHALSRGKLLGAAAAFSRFFWRKEFPDEVESRSFFTREQRIDGCQFGRDAGDKVPVI